MRKPIFTGVGTAIITPFRNGEIDYIALGALIERQISAGVAALVVGGTTGEAATLGDTERYELFKRAAEFTAGRVKLIFGTGTNDTRVAVRHTEAAERIGCDGVLLVTPYYNRGTSEGIYRHYKAIMDSTPLPAILYNVPSRTGVNLPIHTIERLADEYGGVSVKEASDSVERLAALAALGDVTLYAGNDAATYTVLALGGAGVISVTSNLYPRDMQNICNLFFTKSFAKSLKKQNKLLPVINSMFLETNPAPIKYALAELGVSTEEMRLPMYPVSVKTRAAIDAAIEQYEKR